MDRLEVFIDRELEDGRFVVTNNSAIDLPLGITFVSVQTRRAILDGENCRIEPLAEAEVISLQLVEVDIFRKLVPQLPPGFSAAVRLVGEGAAKLHGQISRKVQSAQVFLSAASNAA